MIFIILVINSNLCPILHRLATIHPWPTDGQTHNNVDNPCHRSSTT